MRFFEAQFQLGKSGITDTFITALAIALKTHRQLRIAVLKSSGRTSATMKKMAEEIVAKMPINCIFKIIGFTIILRKQRKKGEDEKDE